MSARAWQWRRSKPPIMQVMIPFSPEELPSTARLLRRVELARQRRVFRTSRRAIQVRISLAGNPEEAGEK